MCITLYQFAPSFNSRKVRFALGLKGVQYDTVEATDETKPEIIKLSGQPMSPIIKHNDTVMFDSGAIVRYIDANIDGPKLFSETVEGMRLIEGWESRARSEILNPYLKIVGQIMSGNKDEAIMQEGRQEFFEGAGNVETALNENGVLLGDSLTAADIFCGCYLAYGFLTTEQAGKRPPLVWSLNNLALTEQFPKLAQWYDKLKIHDKF